MTLGVEVYAVKQHVAGDQQPAKRQIDNGHVVADAQRNCRTARCTPRGHPRRLEAAAHLPATLAPQPLDQFQLNTSHYSRILARGEVVDSGTVDSVSVPNHNGSTTLKSASGVTYGGPSGGIGRRASLRG